eukprot:4226125-Alexandrium_andersonii.AAC.1
MGRWGAGSSGGKSTCQARSAPGRKRRPTGPPAVAFRCPILCFHRRTTVTVLVQLARRASRS